MSAADGSIDPKEVAYLGKIAATLGIDARYLNVFEASFAQQNLSENLEAVVLEEIQDLLDPAPFHDLDIIFTEAANNLVESLPQPVTSDVVAEHQVNSAYVDLEHFQQNRTQLDQIYAAVAQLIRECADKSYIPETLVQDFEQIWERLRSQQFRIAVVGELSQGKSTFLNALLGEKIQPTRATPCSGTLTVFRHGKQKRVICRHRDGREEEISIDLCQEKAAISKEAAHGKTSASQALLENTLENTIEEIIFEHPDLELRKSRVEIVDSPGLNEPDDRTRVTQKLLKGTDAVIFLANAARPSTKWEQDFLTYDLRQQMRVVVLPVA
ncbi:dynamin family protein [Trichothermofontia sp.]